MSTSAYKKKRAKLAKKNGFCIRHWGVKSVPGYTECTKCRTRSIKLRDSARRQNICMSDLTNPVMPGKTICAICSLKRRLKRLKRLGLPDSEVEKAKQASEAFNGECDSCGALEAGNSYEQFSLDHDPIRLTFRGIICQNCNLCLGHMKDNPERLEDAAAYLRRLSLTSTKHL